MCGLLIHVQIVINFMLCRVRWISASLDAPATGFSIDGGFVGRFVLLLLGYLAAVGEWSGSERGEWEEVTDDEEEEDEEEEEEEEEDTEVEEEVKAEEEEKEVEEEEEEVEEKDEEEEEVGGIEGKMVAVEVGEISEE